MPKKKESENKIENLPNERFSIVALTLGIAGFYSLLISGLFALPFFIVGLIFSIIQKRKRKDKLTKIALIINLIGLILWVVYLVILVVYLIPMIQEFQSGNFI